MRLVDVPEISGDVGKIRAATGWEPRIALKETLRDCLESWRKKGVNMDYRVRYGQWLASPFVDEASTAELRAIADESEIQDRFYRDLEFGTGGLRGVMGAGSNRMNAYVIRWATKGLADYLLNRGTDACQRGVVIAFDVRHHSREFASQAAAVLCACGIKTYVFDDIMPTPVLSFAVRHLGCAAGIVLTASHNPKEYNGYKVYDAVGCQIVPEIADAIIAGIQGHALLEDFARMPESEAKEAGLWTEVGEEVLSAFLNAVKTQSCLPGEKSLKVVYTPLHGTGKVPVMRILKETGFNNVAYVQEQEAPDGDFPTVQSPNPEEHEALKLGILQAQRTGADLVVGTDPDCDRMGIAVLHQGEYRLLTGNQIGALLADYVLRSRKDSLNERSTLVKTIVTNDLGASVARAYGLNVVETLTGFKYIGQQIGRFEAGHSNEFVMGYEESYGYLVGTHARDKDAVVAAMLICEAAEREQRRGRTLVDALAALYDQYGYYYDALVSYTLRGKEGGERMQGIMAELRRQGGSLFEGVAQVKDYLPGADGLPESDVVKILFQDGSWIAVRPSGTEPKIKVYYSLRAANEAAAKERFYVLSAGMAELVGER